MTAPLFSALIDHAPIFPPERAPMSQAVDRHRRFLAGPEARMLGPFLCAASRLEEMRAALAVDDRFRVGVVADQGAAALGPVVDTIDGDDRLALAQVELALPPAGALAEVAEETIEPLQGLSAFVEVPLVPGWEEALGVIVERRQAAKLRTGGLSAEAFPSGEQVTEFILACVEGGVPFKCTAGLHSAIRYRDPDTGFEHHGFLNLLAATHAALSGSVEECRSWIGEQDGEALAAWARNLDDTEAGRLRATFVSFGSCSFTEPVESLFALGLEEEVQGGGG